MVWSRIQVFLDSLVKEILLNLNPLSTFNYHTCSLIYFLRAIIGILQVKNVNVFRQ